MNRRDIFFVTSLACLGLFLLLGIFLWKESMIRSQELDKNQEVYASQLEELKKQENSAGTGAAQAGQEKDQPVNTTSAPAATDKTAPAQSTATKPVPAATAKHKVIEINLKGAKAEQSPKLVTSQHDKIVYEVPADVDVNVLIIELISAKKSPANYNKEHKAAK